MLAGLLAAAGGTVAPANAVQALGNDVVPWSNGWSWTYATSFKYVAEEANVTINESLTYTVAGVEDFEGHEAYRLNITGTITGGSGTAAVEGIGNASLGSFSGTVTGTRFVRVSDLALLQETQAQNLKATATVVIISAPITASLNLQLNPSPSWKAHNFPLNAGDNWQMNESIDYTGGFTYDAGSYGGGTDTFAGTLPFQAPVNVSSATINPGIGTVTTDLISASSADGQTVDNIWWSPTFKNDAREVLQLPLDGAALTLTRNLTSASIPAPTTTISQTIMPSLSCAGGQVAVTGQLSTFAAGVPVTARLDQSQINPGQEVTATANTTANGNYSIPLTVPADNEGLSKNGSRANWGVVVSAPGATNAKTLVVTNQNCTTLTYTGPASAMQGGPGLVSAQLTDLGGGPVGGRTVTFAISGGGTASATTNASGVASTTITVPGPPRSATITASVAQSGTQTAASDTKPFTVTKVATSTNVIPSESPATINEPMTFTASVTPTLAGSPTGSVQFAVDGTNFGAAVPLAGGSATSAAYVPTALGNQVVTATYLGDTNFASSASAGVEFLVRPPLLATTTTSGVSPAAAVYGQTIDLTATVAATGGGATPTGSVIFKEGGTTLGSAPLVAGSASTTIPAPGVGSHSIVATYSGDPTYRVSSAAPKTLTVAKAEVDVDVVSSDTSTVSGESVNITASVSPVAPGGGTPNGSVQLMVDGSPVGDPVVLTGGSAAFPPLTSLLAGAHNVAVEYSGSANYEDGSGSVAQDVTKAATTTILSADPSPSAQDQNVTFKAHVSPLSPGSGSPTGTIVFTSNGETIGAAPLVADEDGGSTASVTTADLAPDSYSVNASYDGDAAYQSSVAAPLSHTVIAGIAIVPTETVASSTQNPSVFGELISFTATVEADNGSTPTGFVQFSVDGANLGGQVALDAQGSAVSTLIASPDPGSHTVIASFIPDAGFGSSGDIITQTVASAGVDLDVVSSAPASTYGQSVTFTATATSLQADTGSPAGFVQFNVDGQPLGDAVELVDGVATSPAVANLLPGAHPVSVTYSGDLHFAPALGSLTQNVAKVATTTTLATSATATSFGQPVTLTATVDPALNTLGSPGGSVSFVDGSTTLATVPVSAAAGSNATASLTVSNLGAGPHPIKAVYSGTSSFEPSSSAVKTVTVAKQATSMYAQAAVVRLLPLGLPLGTLKVTLTSANGPVAGVPVVFTVGGATVCTSTTFSTGEAYCSASHLLVQLILFNGYKATYAGDANYLPSSGKAGIIK